MIIKLSLQFWTHLWSLAWSYHKAVSSRAHKLCLHINQNRDRVKKKTKKKQNADFSLPNKLSFSQICLPYLSIHLQYKRHRHHCDRHMTSVVQQNTSKPPFTIFPKTGLQKVPFHKHNYEHISHILTHHHSLSAKSFPHSLIKNATCCTTNTSSQFAPNNTFQIIPLFQKKKTRSNFSSKIKKRLFNMTYSGNTWQNK